MSQLISFLLLIIMFFFSCNSTRHGTDSSGLRVEKIASVQETRLPSIKNSDGGQEWHELLPDCPCRNPDFDTVKNNDGWAREKRMEEMSRIKKLVIGKRDFTKFHPGAAAAFRSYPYVETRISGKKFKSGQQCTYDETGNLIKGGAAAGTPDKVSPASGENSRGNLRVNIFRVYYHVKLDANPWEDGGWEKYNKLWPPSQGVNCHEK